MRGCLWAYFWSVGKYQECDSGLPRKGVWATNSKGKKLQHLYEKREVTEKVWKLLFYDTEHRFFYKNKMGRKVMKGFGFGFFFNFFCVCVFVGFFCVCGLVWVFFLLRDLFFLKKKLPNLIIGLPGMVWISLLNVFISNMIVRTVFDVYEAKLGRIIIREGLDAVMGRSKRNYM